LKFVQVAGSEFGMEVRTDLGSGDGVELHQILFIIG
jgi:hypothetical protein